MMQTNTVTTRRIIITVFGVILIATGLFLMYGSEFGNAVLVSGSKHGLYDIRQSHLQNSKGNCTTETRELLINSPLPIKVNKNVNIETLELSGCFVINATNAGLWRLIDERNFADVKCGPTEKHFLVSPRNKTRTALKSLPGSGNTWVRYLLEEVTGIYTGSIYGNSGLFKVFPGERTTSNVIAIKTHASISRSQYDKAILIVRDVFDATLAEYNRQKTNQIGIPKKSYFNAGVLKSWLHKQVSRNYYTEPIKTFTGDMFVLFYERLKSDMLNSLTKLAAFCQAEVTLKRLWCTYQNREGYKHRGKKPEWMSRKKLVDEGMEGSISKWKEAIRFAIDNRKFNCSTN